MPDDKVQRSADLAAYDADDRPFDFTAAEFPTALICTGDQGVREKIGEAVTRLGYRLTNPSGADEALKKMRFHVYDLIVVDETYDTQNPDDNLLLRYLEELPTNTRRRVFVALLTARHRTSDNLIALKRSVNSIINLKNLEDLEIILKSGLGENRAFYHIFKETMEKFGRI